MTKRKVPTSPVPPKPANANIPGHLTFAGIIQPLLAGKRITKLEWKDPSIYLTIYDGKLCIFNADKKVHPLIVSDGDLIGMDWVVIDG